MKLKLEIEVPDECIVNALDNADIGYWATIKKGCRSHAELLKGNQTAIVEESEGPHDDSDVSVHTLTGAKVRQGLKIMAEKYPHQFKYVMADDTDAESGDVLVQCSLFGELVYG